MVSTLLPGLLLAMLLLLINALSQAIIYEVRKKRETLEVPKLRCEIRSLYNDLDYTKEKQERTNRVLEEVVAQNSRLRRSLTKIKTFDTAICFDCKTLGTHIDVKG